VLDELGYEPVAIDRAAPALPEVVVVQSVDGGSAPDSTTPDSSTPDGSAPDDGATEDGAPAPDGPTPVAPPGDEAPPTS
jgi:hypothetical protein